MQVGSDVKAVVAPPQLSYAGEMCGIFKLAWPQSLSFMLSMVSQQINTIFVGRLGARQLGASTLALMFCNVSGFSIVYGGLTGLDTLGAQAFGAGQFALVGVLCQRALAMCTVLVMAVAALWYWGAGPALRLL